ncbi:hypothetical protein ACT2FY_36375 [Paraburkholderia fungorum]|uniref:hypothetical protein n=1 Tax=Paraburkholderia fungorum TaxID=134537 RepID=UPI00402B8EA4
MVIYRGKVGFVQLNNNRRASLWQSASVACLVNCVAAAVLFFVLSTPRAMADSAECARLEGNGVRAETGVSGRVLQGAFALSDREPVAIFDQKGGRIFGSLSIVPFRQGYEAFWKPMSGSRELLIMLNGTQEAALIYPRNVHWLIPFPLGTVVGPLAIRSCAGAFGNPGAGFGR